MLTVVDVVATFDDALGGVTGKGERGGASSILAYSIKVVLISAAMSVKSSICTVFSSWCWQSWSLSSCCHLFHL